MTEDKYQAQRKEALTNRRIILEELGLKESMTFGELKKSFKKEYSKTISSPTLSNHLTKLRKQGFVVKELEEDITEKDRQIYKLTEKASNLPEVQNLFFEIIAYHRILRELIESGEPIQFSTKELKRGERERLIYWGLGSAYLKKKSEYEIVKALDKWLSPIVIFSIIQELKGKTNFTESIQGLIKKLLDVVKQKDLTKIEEALNQIYSQKTDFDNVSIMDSLEDIISHVEKQKMVDEHFNKIFREYKLRLESGVVG